MRATGPKARKALLTAGAAGLVLAALTLTRRRFSFTGKVVLVTGGSRGLGLLLARQLAAEGARLALVARSPGDLKRAADELRRRGAEVLALPADVGDQAQIEAAVAETIRRYGRLDVLINNAGVIQVGPLEHMTLADFDTAMRTHFWGPLYAVRAALPQLKRQGGGRVVNIASIGGEIAIPHLTPYSASKHALVGLSDALRAELAKDNIKVTTVSPWLMRTGSYRNVTVKGRHERELAWFALGDSLPLLSMRGEDAARQILEACRRAAPGVVLSPYGKVAVAANALLPGVTAAIMAGANRFLPGPVAGGTEAKKGFESTSPLAPSVLTRLSDDAAARNNQLHVEEREAKEE